MDEKTKQKIEEIRKRLKEYRKHQNDPYAYFQGEIKEVEELLRHAPEDIEFLLNELRRSRVLATLRHSPSQAAEK